MPRVIRPASRRTPLVGLLPPRATPPRFATVVRLPRSRPFVVRPIVGSIPPRPAPPHSATIVRLLQGRPFVRAPFISKLPPAAVTPPPPWAAYRLQQATIVQVPRAPAAGKAIVGKIPPKANPALLYLPRPIVARFFPALPVPRPIVGKPPPARVVTAPVPYRFTPILVRDPVGLPFSYKPIVTLTGFMPQAHQPPAHLLDSIVVSLRAFPDLRLLWPLPRVVWRPTQLRIAISIYGPSVNLKDPGTTATIAGGNVTVTLADPGTIAALPLS